jgi:hypothetical protein
LTLRAGALPASEAAPSRRAVEIVIDLRLQNPFRQSFWQLVESQSLATTACDYPRQQTA